MTRQGPRAARVKASAGPLSLSSRAPGMEKGSVVGDFAVESSIRDGGEGVSKICRLTIL